MEIKCTDLPPPLQLSSPLKSLSSLLSNFIFSEKLEESLFKGPDHWLALTLTHSQTHASEIWFIYVTVAEEDASSKVVNVVADVEMMLRKGWQ